MPTVEPPQAVVIGAGPAGLMAAQTLAEAGWAVDVYDAMPSAGRKFLLAGIGGLNLTHAEPLPAFIARYGEQAAALAPLLHAFGPAQVRAWAQALGVDTFVGSSQRVFPTEMKAAPLLRAWLHRLRALGVRLHMRHRWLGWAADGALRFDCRGSEVQRSSAATVLALGGASWPKLGSDGAWAPWLAEAGVAIAPLQSANCGFDIGWSEHLATRHAGAALKNVALTLAPGVAPGGAPWRQLGECVVTATGLEGSLVYAASAALRGAIARDGAAPFTLDLLPQREAAWVAREVAHPRGTRSLATHLKSRLNLAGAKAALLWECSSRAEQADPAMLAARIKALPLVARAPRPIAEAISSAGGVRLDAVDANWMLHARPGVFCAGEMLDWEAPTGGYLLTACLATGVAAARGVVRWRGGEAPLV